MMKILFIGNSATFVNDIPGTLQRLAGELGIELEVGRILKGGYELARHADTATEHGRAVMAEIERGYDIVFLQDNGNCIESDERRAKSREAFETLANAAKMAGAKVWCYVRPPYGYEKFGYAPLEQCKEFDKFFGELCDEFDASRVYVNRAFAYAIKNLNYPIWGSDNGHTSPHGAYLAVAVFFASLFKKSATALGDAGLPPDDTRVLREVADKIALEGFIPW
jgi:hypothetical protein